MEYEAILLILSTSPEGNWPFFEKQSGAHISGCVGVMSKTVTKVFCETQQ